MAEVDYTLSANLRHVERKSPASVWEEVTHVYYKEDPTDDQVRWGNCADPRGLLEPGKVYALKRVQIHSWHTKLYLGNPGNETDGFNSVSFEPAALRVQP